MKRMMLAGSALVALGGCATGQPYTGVEAGPTAVSMEPLGAVARRGLGGCAGYEPCRERNANTARGSRATPGVTVQWRGLPLIRSSRC